MILADTSIWVDHLRTAKPQMTLLLADAAIIQHAFVVGELAVGTLPDRMRNLARLRAIEQIGLASDDEFYGFLQGEKLAGTGLGFVDIHLLASVAANPDTLLWTRDKRLLTQAQRLGLAYPHP